jgi:DNA-binding transcriptional ArsR family regulator
MSFLEIANREIAAGIPVIPIKAGQKGPPLIEGGSSSGSTDPQQIEAWAAQFPEANVGVVCTLNGILIVDDDDGVVEQSGVNIETRVVESSPGHRQYYFKQTPATSEVGNIPQRAGFSLRSHNHYGLAAGSLHPGGHYYRLLVDAAIQEMPAELLEYLQQRYKAAKVSLGGELKNLNGGKLGEGEGRNDDMTRLAGIIWDGKIDEEEFVEQLTAACELRHDPPYPEHRIRDVVERATRDWEPSYGLDWADLLPDEGYWVGLTRYVSEEAYREARPKALSLRELDEQIQISKSLEEIVKGMLPSRSVNIIGGDSGLGKSPLLCQLAVCVAAGLPFLGHEVRQGKVLIADYENDYALSGMLHSVAKAVRADEQAIEDNLLILARGERFEVIEEVRRSNARLVIVDSLRGFDSMAEGKSENTSRLISDLQDVDTCWLLIHHLRKQKADSPRPDLNESDTPLLTWLENLSGHRSLVNQTFTRMGIDKSDRNSADLVLRGYFKGKGEFGPFHLERIYDDAGEPIGFAQLAGVGLLSVNQKTELRKIRAAADGKALSFAELTEILGAKSSASRLLSACRSAGLVSIEGEGRGKRYRFPAPDEGAEKAGTLEPTGKSRS